jgi:Holliday junction resolvasome RuvABC endonuclease subunit
VTHLAFDLGLHTTGIAWDGGTDHHTCPHRHRRSPITPEREHERFGWWRDTFRALLLPHPRVNDVVVEAPFIHRSHPSGAINLIVLHGILRAVALDGGHRCHTVDPATLKRWATGRGNADKTAMMQHARALGWDGEDHNEADAFLLWCYWSEEGAVR